MDKDTHTIFETLIKAILEKEKTAPKAADLDKDGKLSKYEKKKSDAILKNDKDPKNDDHICATKVEHAEFGIGQCISERHASPDENGHVSWYAVMFEHGTEVIDTVNVNVLEESSHHHK